MVRDTSANLEKVGYAVERMDGESIMAEEHESREIALPSAKQY